MKKKSYWRKLSLCWRTKLVHRSHFYEDSGECIDQHKLSLGRLTMKVSSLTGLLYES